MTREIKFRVFDQVLKKVYPVKSIWGFGEVEFVCTPYDKGAVTLFHSFELMQFTGLTDKNGVDIYEGDIVQIQYDECYSSLATIEFRKDVASFVVNENGGWDSIEIMQEGIVIGNIHENHELLK